jgi:hypothetical protein
MSFPGELNEAVGLLKRRVALLWGTEVYMEITSALHFDHDSMFLRETAAFLWPQTLDARDGDSIEHISAEGNGPWPKSDALRIYGEVAVVSDDATMGVRRTNWDVFLRFVSLRADGHFHSL